MNALFALAFLVAPALIVYLCGHFKPLRTIGAVLLCYAAGVVVGNVGVLPEGFAPVQSAMADVSVVLALPLLLFSIDVRAWFKVAGKGMLCMALAALSIIAVTFALQLTFHSGRPDAWQLAGLAVGVYTGGTPNLAAIKAAIGVANDTYILFHTYDAVISFAYIVVMASVARPILLRVARMRGFEPAAGAPETGGDMANDAAGISFREPGAVRGLVLASLLSAAIVGASAFLGSLAPGTGGTAVTILAVTTLSLAASFIGPVRRVRHTFQAGMYVIYVFCFVVASMTKLDSLVRVDWAVLGYVSASIFGSLVVHALLSKLAGIDVDTFIVTSVSAICSPPFVPVLAEALKNRAVLMTGLATGLVDYAAGNYLGVSIAYLFRSLPL